MPDLAVQKQVLVNAATKEVGKAKRKAERWLNEVGGRASIAIELTCSPEETSDKVIVAVQATLISLLLANKPSLKVTVAPLKRGSKGKVQKIALLAYANSSKLDNNENGRDVTINLPTSAES